MTEPDGTESVDPLADPPDFGGRSLPNRLLADRYEIREPLGRGGHATVYRAYDRLLKVEVALKVVHPERDAERALSRVRREVEVARESLSPHLVRIFELGRTEDDIYLSMELLRGGSLRKRLRNGPLPLDEAIQIADAILAGLAALHAKGVIHRDVTPGNILFTERGEAKLGDFGLVRRLEGERSQVTIEGGVLGTLGYLSPEQLLGKDIGPRSDLYAAGVVLFEMLAGRPPREAASELGHRLAAFSAAPDVRQFRPEVPRWLARVVARLLERRPADRFPNAEAALASLRKRSAPPHYRLRRRLFRTAAVALLLLPRGGGLVTPARGPTFSHLIPVGETEIAAVSSSGERMWTIEDVDPDLANRTARVRIRPGGPRLIAIVLFPPGRWPKDDATTLSFLDPETGQEVKRVTLPFGASFFPDAPPRFMLSSITAVDLLHDGTDQVLVSYTHVPEAPCYTVLYSPRADRARIVFYANGHQRFQGAVDLDGDALPELLFAGVNNGWNWVNAVAAVRLDPLPWTEEDWMAPPTGAPDVSEQPDFDRLLLWYAVVPRGHLKDPSLSIDAMHRKLTINYVSGKTRALGFSGFEWGTPAGPLLEKRQEARNTTYSHLREAERLRRAGAFDLAMSEARAAQASAAQAEEVWLGQYAERLQAKILVEEDEAEEAEALFSSLVERAEDAPEVAYDAALAFHLHSDLPRAIAWYDRGMGRESALGAGKNKQAFLIGKVLALVEMKRYAEALAAVNGFGAIYPSWQNQIWLFRDYVRWRAGRRPEPPKEVQANWTDLERYWALEFEFATGGDPVEMLPRVDRFLAERPETQAEARSLRAEILATLGRAREASEAAQIALEEVQAAAGRNLIARGHADLIAERAHRLRQNPPGTAPADRAGAR